MDGSLKINTNVSNICDENRKTITNIYEKNLNSFVNSFVCNKEGKETYFRIEPHFSSYNLLTMPIGERLYHITARIR